MLRSATSALDQLGQARSLLQYAGSVEGAGRTEDDLAYFRDEREFLNLQFCELPNGDFAHAMARLLYFATYQHLLYDELRSCADETLAGVAGKAVKEVAYHVDHATQWVLRLGDGTEESHRRMQAALEALWPYTAELFESDALVQRLDVAVDPVDASRRLAQPGPGCHRRVHLRAALVRRTSTPAAARDSTPSTWAFCWPSCSTWRVRIRGRHGDRRRHLRSRRRGRGSRGAGADDRGPRRTARRAARGRRGRRDDHPDVLRLSRRWT